MLEFVECRPLSTSLELSSSEPSLSKETEVTSRSLRLRSAHVVDFQEHVVNFPKCVSLHDLRMLLLPGNGCHCVGPCRGRRLQREGPEYFHRVFRRVVAVGGDEAHALDHPHAGINPAEDRVLAVQPRRGLEQHEKLRAVRVGLRWGGRQYL